MSITRQSNTTGLVQRSLKTSEIDFNINYKTVEQIVSSESTNNFTVQDKQMLTQTEAVVYNEYNLRPEVVVPTGLTFNFESLNPEIATVDTDTGKTTRVTDGVTPFLVKFGNLVKRINLDFTQSGGQETTKCTGWVSGSLIKECADAVDNRISGLTPAQTVDIYSTQNHGDGIYERNTSVWCSDLDLTCISPWNNTGGNHRAGVLISPDCIAFAEHYQIHKGDIIRFITSDNTVIERTVVNKQSISPPDSSDGYSTDITIGILDSEVPDSISCCKVLPSNFTDYLPNINEGIPALCLDQEEKALITDFYKTNSGKAHFTAPENSREDYYEKKIIGDSGNPAFLIINNELVLITTWTFGGAGAGPDYSAYINEIESAMANLGSSYGLTQIDLNPYPTY